MFTCHPGLLSQGGACCGGRPHGSGAAGHLRLFAGVGVPWQMDQVMPLVGGLKHCLFFHIYIYIPYIYIYIIIYIIIYIYDIDYIGNNPSHWLFFSRWLKPPTRLDIGHLREFFSTPPIEITHHDLWKSGVDITYYYGNGSTWSNLGGFSPSKSVNRSWNPWARNVGNVSVADGSALVQRNYSSWAAFVWGAGSCGEQLWIGLKQNLEENWKTPYISWENRWKSMVSARF